MKTSRRPLSPAPRPGLSPDHREIILRRREREQGIAIITVLAVLLLMSVLVLAFFQMASNEFTASNNYEYSIRSRQAADTVVSMVTGQIRKATTQTDVGGAGRFAWSSQPGAITTFRTKQQYQEYEQAAFLKYKLYSSDKMIEDGDYNLSNDIPSDWDEHPELWADLNEPVVEETGDNQPRLHFPIIDPRAFEAGGKATDQDGVDNGDGIAGFGFMETTSAGNAVAGIKKGQGADARLPMPVRWLYMLADGTIGYLDDAGTFVRSFGEGNVSKENPVTQRFAFWTDDETSKINVNTASDGQYWDYPSTASGSDRDFAKYLPAKNELQRFPGQPAKTSLSVVFDPLGGDSKQNEIYLAAPKIQSGGTMNGTRPGTTPIVLDQDRLYATEDEYLFGMTNDRNQNTLFGNPQEKERLEQARFFLTASSSAPETTLLGTPRICMWGMYGSGQRSAYDNVIAYCSTIPTSPQGSAPNPNSRRYFFQRNSSGSRHNEIYGASGGENIRLLQNYIWPLMAVSNPIPGFGGSFAAKYGAGEFGDRRQIGTEAFDYLRNINVSEFGSTLFGAPTSRGYGQIASCCICGGTGPHQTVWSDTRRSFTKGFGRMYTVSEVSLVFIVTAQFTPNGDNKGDPANRADLTDGNKKRIQPAILIETFCPSHGYTGIMPNTRLQVIDGSARMDNGDVNKVDPPRIDTGGANADFYIQDVGNKNKANAAYVIGDTTPAMVGRRTWGGTGGASLFLTKNGHGGPGLGYMGTNSIGQPTDGHIIVDANAQTMNVQEIKMRIILYDDVGNPNVNQLIQAFDVTFPAMKNLPVPDYSDTQHDTWTKRISRAMASNANPEDHLVLGGNKEVVRSMVISHGDYRLVSARRTTTAVGNRDIFQPHPDYDGTKKYAHSLVRADGSPMKEATFAPLVSGVTYSPDIQPDFPMSPSDPNYFTWGKVASANIDPAYVYQADPAESGDFDTGLGIQPDGAYINRPDEGSTSGENAYYKDTSMRISTPLAGNSLTPNRIISGPVQFGSLSTGVQANVPWRTLLFRPDPKHFGAKHNSKLGMVPPDHLFLDYFWMPIVEPYAISTPFATAGKINLNCQIVPFDYIKRQTGLHALFKGERVITIPDNAGMAYKSGGNSEYRRPIDAVETMKQFEHRFKRGELFRSGSEICEIYLVPKGQKLGEPQSIPTPAGDPAFDYPVMRDYWKTHRLTGDNLKERPYASIYPRVTTKSNTFRVHMIVQHLKKARSSDPDGFDPEKDRVTSQWRGSAVIERNIDPNNRDIPSYFTGNSLDTADAKINQKSLEYFYNYRVLNVKQFTP